MVYTPDKWLIEDDNMVYTPDKWLIKDDNMVYTPDKWLIEDDNMVYTPDKWLIEDDNMVYTPNKWLIEDDNMVYTPDKWNDEEYNNRCTTFLKLSTQHHVILEARELWTSQTRLQQILKGIGALGQGCRTICLIKLELWCVFH